MEMNQLENRLPMRVEGIVRSFVARLVSLYRSLAAVKKNVISYLFTVSEAAETESRLELVTHDDTSIRSSDLRRKRLPSHKELVVDTSPLSEAIVFEKGNEWNESKIYDAFGFEFEPHFNWDWKPTTRAVPANDSSTSVARRSYRTLPQTSMPVFHYAIPVIPADVEPTKNIGCKRESEIQRPPLARKSSHSPMHKSQVSVWIPRSPSPRLIVKPRPSTLSADQSVQRMIKDAERMMRGAKKLLARSHKLESQPMVSNTEENAMERIPELESVVGEYFEVAIPEDDVGIVATI
ncbi:hypothetical protein Poli38472_013509 [Pythium oligandrum]|uniref:Uncharacterized protein n=1 Tax=Pythium oligandrum TaxID=41045 RepID=A0A8K1FC81_PYTOL|nr:hypothetical protein Poli38472_013509 [Pythium oligandrum]|eukprot:TMW58035.1 hypothetical protein Poli38472_013509 [Pythium oligandrum]